MVGKAKTQYNNLRDAIIEAPRAVHRIDNALESQLRLDVIVSSRLAHEGYAGAGESKAYAAEHRPEMHRLRRRN